MSTAKLDRAASELPCIRCGDCARACPVRLQPQQLLWQLQAGNLDRARIDGIGICTECGKCDDVCPSLIPLTARLRAGKHAIALAALQWAQAQAARERFEARGHRLQRESDERSERERTRQQAMASPDAIAAALARARAKRGASGGAKSE